MGYKYKCKEGELLNGIKFIKYVDPPCTNRKALFECPICGNQFITKPACIGSGHTTSCGCKTNTGGKPRHRHTTNKGFRSPTYLSWSSMMRRCYGTDINKVKSYQSKGIIVCERWFDFNNFLQDMGERPIGMTLDRYPNNKGNYEPGNVRWATPVQQSRNLTTNLKVSYKGEEKTLMEWSSIIGLNYHTLRERIFLQGIPIVMAFTEPKRSAKICNFLKEKRNELVSNFIPHSFGVINKKTA